MSGDSVRIGYPRWESSIPPAPGDLRIIQAFVNTHDVEADKDDVGTPLELTAWLRRWQLIEAEDSVSPAEARQAHDLREGLCELMLANNGEPKDPDRLVRLEKALQELPLRGRLVREGRFELVGVTEGWGRAAGRLLTIAVLAIGDGSWSKLKACRRVDCQWVFFDASKNRSRSWCSMKACGNLMKARAYRQRLRDRDVTAAK